jgi:hypothetical protein
MSGDGENTNGTGVIQRSFLGGWLDADDSTRVWQWLRRWLLFEVGLDEKNHSGRLLI